MDKLKTLKDIMRFSPAIGEDKYSPYCKSNENGSYICHYELKVKAIEWVRAFKLGECHTDFAADGRNGQENIEEWIEYFFGITEEDLL